jgi:Flp pilus assembly protein TadG
VLHLNRPRGARPGPHRADGGQTLVEFAFVVPLFLLLVFAVIEFTFVFSAMLGISYASRDAALLAAEAGNAPGADCVIIKAVDKAVSAPASDDRIDSVVIYRADQNGVEMSGVANRWTRGSSTSCADGTTIPYSRQTNGYPETSRCNYLAGDVSGGCESGHPGLDTIGVRITYTHEWVTPLGGFPGPGFGGQGGGGFTLTQSNSMRMEPVL